MPYHLERTPHAYDNFFHGFSVFYICIASCKACTAKKEGNIHGRMNYKDTEPLMSAFL
jgi:hypothetical protein